MTTKGTIAFATIVVSELIGERDDSPHQKEKKE